MRRIAPGNGAHLFFFGEVSLHFSEFFCGEVSLHVSERDPFELSCNGVSIKCQAKNKSTAVTTAVTPTR